MRNLSTRECVGVANLVAEAFANSQGRANFASASRPVETPAEPHAKAQHS